LFAVAFQKGSVPHNAVQLTGQTFGRWTVIEKIKEVKPVRWRCLCSCGREGRVTTQPLLNGGSRSCGCLSQERTRGNTYAKTHGLHKIPEHASWAAAKSRCHNLNDKDFGRYGGRGIVVCERWRGSFIAFFADMGTRPSPGHSLDRIDNDGPYEPGNCRWATRKEQAMNKRDNSRVRRGNHLITLCGETLPAAAWADRLGLSWTGMMHRVRRGWSDNKILETPRHPHARK
jgi:hypothetical protein